MQLMTEEYDGADASECMLTPGEALLNCDGQDITKKGGGKGRNRVLTILPLQLGLGNKITDCVLGNLRKFSTDAPELVMEVDGGSLVFPGKFEFPSTKFLSILCQPSSSKKTGQSALTDVFDRVLVFGQPTLVPTCGPPHRQRHSVTQSSSVAANESSQESGISITSESGGAAHSRVSVHHGISSLADPIKPSTAKRLATSTQGITASGTKVPRVKGSGAERAGPSTSSKQSAIKKSKQVSTGSDSDGGGSDSDGSGSSSSSGLSAADSASDAESEIGNVLGADSPVDRRSSSRRASASKPVNYKVDDIEDSDTESGSSSSDDGSSSAGEESERSDNIMDVSSDEEVQRKPPPKRTSSTTSTASLASKAAKSTPKDKKPAASAKKAVGSPAASVTKKAAPKVPVARKLADSTQKRKSSSGAKGAYFSESDSDDGAGASDSSGSFSGTEESSRLGGSSASSSSDESEDSEYSGDGNRKAKKQRLSQASQASPGSAKKGSATKAPKAATKKPTAKATETTKTKPKPAAKAKPTAASPKKSSAKAAPKTAANAKSSAGSAATKKKAAPKRKASAALDSDVEVISIDDSSDEDYSE